MYMSDGNARFTGVPEGRPSLYAHSSRPKSLVSTVGVKLLR